MSAPGPLNVGDAVRVQVLVEYSSGRLINVRGLDRDDEVVWELVETPECFKPKPGVCGWYSVWGSVL